jgi:hypothetical protein
MSDQILLVISEPVLSKKYWLSRCEVPIHMDGEEDGTWSRAKQKQKRWVCRPFTERYCIWVGAATAPVLQGCVPMSRSNSARHFRTCLIKEDIGSQMRVPIHMVGEEGGTWCTYWLRKNDGGVSAFTERYCIKVRNGSCPARVACRCP